MEQTRRGGRLSGQQNMGFIISVAKLGHGREIKKKKESKVRWDETQQGADMKRALITEMGNYYAQYSHLNIKFL